MPSENRLIAQIRLLSQALILSVAINIGLTATFAYWFVNERSPLPFYESKPKELVQIPMAEEKSQGGIIRAFKSLSLEQLVAKLGNAEIVDKGYTQRDLALACLVGMHHFDLNRACPGGLEQPRVLFFDEELNGSFSKLVVYPRLSDEQFDSIIDFAHTEQWPITHEGLFLKLKHMVASQRPSPQDSPHARLEASLAEAFFITSEFSSVEMLFNRADVPVKREDLLTMLTDGTWEMLSSFAEQQKTSQDLSSLRRQHFLLEYLAMNSKSAALLLLKTDPAFVSKKLDDTALLTILQIADENTPETKALALEMLAGSRGAVVKKAASSALNNFSAQAAPGSLSPRSAGAQFSLKASAPAKPTHPLLPPTPASRSISRQVSKPLSPPVPEAHTSTTHAGMRRPILAENQLKRFPNQVKDSKFAAPPKEIFRSSPPSLYSSVGASIDLPPSTSSLPAPAVRSKPLNWDRVHVVQEGDNLWKIARFYKIDVDLIRQSNKLKSDALKPGSLLKIPH